MATPKTIRVKVTRMEDQKRASRNRIAPKFARPTNLAGALVVSSQDMKARRSS